nr:MAG TPA: hypothetical protein [Caudoviricetes sp.]DAS57802.1 MAG TPA: hypothetical protein [Caudoviricetes sp.]
MKYCQHFFIKMLIFFNINSIILKKVVFLWIYT